MQVPGEELPSGQRGPAAAGPGVLPERRSAPEAAAPGCLCQSRPAQHSRPGQPGSGLQATSSQVGHVTQELIS